LNLIENTTFQLVQPVTGVNTANSWMIHWIESFNSMKMNFMLMI
jgi:hypothetical protein